MFSIKDVGAMGQLDLLRFFMVKKLINVTDRSPTMIVFLKDAFLAVGSSMIVVFFW